MSEANPNAETIRLVAALTKVEMRLTEIAAIAQHGSPALFSSAACQHSMARILGYTISAQTVLREALA